jgi:molecular chaperone Hsp33
MESALSQPAVQDYCRAFLFEHLDIRGAYVQLHEAWRQMLAGRGYPLPVIGLLGEMAAVTVLIAANLKQPGRMTFQLKGAGPIGLLVLDCDEGLRLRGMARSVPDIAPAAVPDLLGHGQLALTLEVPGMRYPYQSLVPLDGDSIATVFEHYLLRSEQQPARLYLTASEAVAAGLLLQKLPGADGRDADGWNRLTQFAQTLRAEELLGLPTVKLLTRVFPEEDIRVFDPRPVRYHCPRDLDKVRHLLRSLGRAECEAILAEQGAIRIHDDICNHEYVFEATDLDALFDQP